MASLWMRPILGASKIGSSQSINKPRLDPRLVALLGSFSGGWFDSIVRSIPVLALLAVMFYHYSRVVVPILRHGCLHIRPGILHFRTWVAVNCKVINTFFFEIVAIRALILILFMI